MYCPTAKGFQVRAIKPVTTRQNNNTSACHFQLIIEKMLEQLLENKKHTITY
jgi:hypothetical protein